MPGEHVEERGASAGEEVRDGKQRDGKLKGGSKGKDTSQLAAAAIGHVEGIARACQQLKAVNQGLASLFEESYGIQAYGSGRQVSSVLRDLFVQVSILGSTVKSEGFIFGDQISAEESVLQLANRPALQDLQTFNQNPTAPNSSRLVTIPVLYNLLKQEEKEHVHYQKSVILLCMWIYERGMAVLDKLLVHGYGSPPDIKLSCEGMDWRIVGSFTAGLLY
jgi:hypothetical protein